MYINFNVRRQYYIKVSNNLSVSKIHVNKSILCIIYVMATVLTGLKEFQFVDRALA